MFAKIDSDGLSDWGTLGKESADRTGRSVAGRLGGLRVGQMPAAHPVSDRSIHCINNSLSVEQPKGI